MMPQRGPKHMPKHGSSFNAITICLYRPYVMYVITVQAIIIHATTIHRMTMHAMTIQARTIQAIITLAYRP